MDSVLFPERELQVDNALRLLVHLGGWDARVEIVTVTPSRQRSDVDDVSEASDILRDGAIADIPQPLGVRVSGPRATLLTAGPIEPGSLEYAAIWHDGYHAFHRGTRTVELRVTWKSGSILGG
jgi:hypothetical protein